MTFECKKLAIHFPKENVSLNSIKMLLLIKNSFNNVVFFGGKKLGTALDNPTPFLRNTSPSRFSLSAATHVTRRLDNTASGTDRLG